GSVLREIVATIASARRGLAGRKLPVSPTSLLHRTVSGAPPVQVSLGPVLPRRLPDQRAPFRACCPAGRWHAPPRGAVVAGLGTGIVVRVDRWGLRPRRFQLVSVPGGLLVSRGQYLLHLEQHFWRR